MVEHKGDLWASFGHPAHIVGISTNGFVKRDGRAVMGRGCAKQATELLPGVSLLLGSYIRRNGNVPGYLAVGSELGQGEQRLLILPVKHNWFEMASLELVKASIAFLDAESRGHADLTFHVPRLGCGNGRLNWSEIGSLMKSLPDSVWVHH